MKPIYILFVFIIGVYSEQDPHSIRAPIVPQASASHKESDNHSVPILNNKNIITPISDPKTSTNETADHLVSTTPMPTTTTLAPPGGIGSWSVKDEKGNVCILLNGEIAVTVVQEIANKTHTYPYSVPKNATSHGNCSKACIEFDLSDNSSLHLMFEKNTTTSKFYLHAIKAHLFKEKVNNHTSYFDFHNETLHLFENPLDQSYYCARAEENLVAEFLPFSKAVLKVNDFQFQAFMNSSKSEFDTVVDCEAPHTPDVVPIVVGCALAILVILVLVAYLISRRRSQSRGYLSM